MAATDAALVVSVVMETDLFTTMKDQDSEFLGNVMQDLEEHRRNLIAKVRDSNRETIAAYREKFWEKIEDVFKVREEMLTSRRASVDSERQRLVDKHREDLRKVNVSRLQIIAEELGSEGIARAYEKLEEIVRNKVEIYDQDLKKYHDTQFKKARDSAFDTIEICKYLNSEINKFVAYDEFFIQEFARVMGDNESLFEELLRTSDAKFRESLVSYIVKAGGGDSKQEELVRIHREKRETLISSIRIDSLKYEEYVDDHIKENQQIISELEKQCIHCFGTGKISEHFFEVCCDSLHRSN